MYFQIYLSTAIGLTPGGSVTVHTINTNRTRIKGVSHEDQQKFLIISRPFLFRTKNISDKLFFSMYFQIYLSTAIGLTPGGSVTVDTINTNRTRIKGVPHEDQQKFLIISRPFPFRTKNISDKLFFLCISRYICQLQLG